MKKMICEICGSRSIKKENGVFVCQECGTEYSTEEAKNLLTEITQEKESVKKIIDDDNKIVEENDKYVLMNKLLLWVNLLQTVSLFEELDIKTNEEDIYKYTDEDTNKIEDNFPKPTDTNILLSCVQSGNDFYSRVVNIYIEKKALQSSDIPEEASKMFKKLQSSTIKEDEYHAFLIIDGKKLCPYSDTVKQLFLSTQNPSFTLEDWCVMLANVGRMDDEKLILSKASMFSSNIVYDLTDLSKVLIQIIDSKNNIYPHDYKTIYKSLIEDRKKELIDLLKCVPEIEKEFNLPVSYRKTEIVIQLIQFIMEGKAESWKEVVNLFDETVFRSTIISSLSQISSQIKNLTNVVHKGIKQINAHLSDIESSLSRLNSHVVESNKKLNSIATSSFITMWNTL